ncbi:MAG: MBL fold metallo-hydrolase [Actinomycetota bacterium]|nr:MBL fold metallo-hydrolase [Actinomycetota bacterium]
MRVVILGSRGSIPVSGADFVVYGGGTTAFALVVDDRVVGFVDAGTGVVTWRDFGMSVAPSIEVFFTHYHWDHIQGLSMLDLVWSDEHEITVHGPNDPRSALTSVITPPWFPVSLVDAPSIHFESIVGPVELAGLMITPFGVEHPQGAVGYRIDGPSSSVAIVTDHEAGSELDGTIVDAIRGVEVLIHDGQYQPNEIETYRGWGHSTWEGAVAAALLSGANRLILTSLDPRRTDEEIDVIVHTARRRFHSTEAAYPGLSVSL